MRRWLPTLVILSVAWLPACPAERPDDYFVPPPVPRAPPPAVGHGDAVEGAAPARARDATPARELGWTEDEGGSRPSVDEVPSFVGLFRRLSPSVVNIYTLEVVQRRPQGVLPGGSGGRGGTSLGSGMVVDEDGLILTNAHVVENAAEIRVRFHDGAELPARLIGIDPVRDLALLGVDGAGELRPVEPGDSAAVAVGDWVVAIGNPYGLAHTMTQGIVSGKGRAEFISDRMGYLDLIQTDASIHQGSSGSPLFDMRGRVIGVNTAISADGGGIAFAIPWRVVAEAMPRLMLGGQVSRSWLGVYVLPRADAPVGVLVDGLVAGSPADAAGLSPGDLIVGLDGVPVRDVAEFRLRIASSVAGRRILLDVLRRGVPLQLEVEVEEARGIR